MEKINLGSIGLLVDIIGVIVVFIAGLPSSPIHDQNAQWLIDSVEYHKTRIKRRWAYAGLGLILLGFIMQFIYSITVSK